MLANLETIDRNFLLKWGVDKTFYVGIKSLGSYLIDSHAEKKKNGNRLNSVLDLTLQRLLAQSRVFGPSDTRV